jgi:hypothetical protein
VHVFLRLLFQFPDFARQCLQIGLEVGVVLLYLCPNSARVPTERDQRTLGRKLRHL